jgi:hypothetical protein
MPKPDKQPEGIVMNVQSDVSIDYAKGIVAITPKATNGIAAVNAIPAILGFNDFLKIAGMILVKTTEAHEAHEALQKQIAASAVGTTPEDLVKFLGRR